MSNKVQRSLDPKVANARKELLKIVLLKATKEGTEELQTSGLGFVLSALNYWATEARETGLGKPVAKYLRALADMTDAKNETRLMASELRRRKAFDETCALAEKLEKEFGFFNQEDPKDPQP